MYKCPCRSLGNVYFNLDSRVFRFNVKSIETAATKAAKDNSGRMNLLFGLETRNNQSSFHRLITCPVRGGFRYTLDTHKTTYFSREFPRGVLHYPRNRARLTVEWGKLYSGIKTCLWEGKFSEESCYKVLYCRSVDRFNILCFSRRLRISKTGYTDGVYFNNDNSLKKEKKKKVNPCGGEYPSLSIGETRHRSLDSETRVCAHFGIQKNLEWVNESVRHVISRGREIYIYI